MKKIYEEPTIETILFDLEKSVTAEDAMSSNGTHITDGDLIDWE